MSSVLLKKASESDLRFFFDLVNDKEVRRFSFKSDRIRLNNHIDWFKKMLNDKNSHLYVISLDKERVGQVRLVCFKSRWEIGVSLIPRFRGKGLSTIAIKKACGKIAKLDENLKEIFALVKPNNIASVVAFSKAGFEVAGYKLYQNQDCVVLKFPIRKD